VARLSEGGCLLPYAVDESQAAPPVAFTPLLDPAEPFTLDRVIAGLKR
jgi:hypothetical protein